MRRRLRRGLAGAVGLWLGVQGTLAGAQLPQLPAELRLEALPAGPPAVPATATSTLGGCGVMGFSTLGVDAVADVVTLVGAPGTVVSTVTLALPCAGSVVSTFFAEVILDSTFASILLEATCVAGGCTVGTVVRSEPKGTSVLPLFAGAFGGVIVGGSHSLFGVFPSLPPGNYQFTARAHRSAGGGGLFNNRALHVQAYGALPTTAPGRGQ